jgi:hypothetical protein
MRHCIGDNPKPITIRRSVDYARIGFAFIDLGAGGGYGGFFAALDFVFPSNQKRIGKPFAQRMD